MVEKTGKRKTREQLSKCRAPELGYYIIVTDAKETEQNYMLGLRNSMPKDLQRKLVIKVHQTETREMVNEALNLAAMQPEYGEIWIVFDRDQVKDFDRIISSAEKRGVNVGWSNPCIEIWFSAYLGAMPTCTDSVSCCNGFEQRYLQSVQQRYEKSDTTIYSKLCSHGDEKQAIKIAERKYKEHEKNSYTKPSVMCPCTNLHTLIKGIKEKIEKNQNT